MRRVVPRIVPLPYRKVDRKLRALGFVPVRQVGSHLRYEHPDGRACTVPRHDGVDLSPTLLRRIAKEAGLDANQFRA